MSDAFSLFWQKHQKDLRASLRQALADARARKTGRPAETFTVAGATPGARIAR